MSEGDYDPRVLAAVEGLPDDMRDFARVYEQEIRPHLLEHEQERKDAVAKARNFTLYGVLAGLVIAGGGFAIFREPFTLFLGVMAGMGLAAWGNHALKKFKNKAKQLIVSPVAAKFGLTYLQDCGSQPAVMEFKDRRLLPSWDRSSFEDQLVGQRQGVDFTFFEAHLEQKRQSRSSNGSTTTRWVTVFRGQCIAFDFHKRFHGETLVARDMGLFNAFGAMGSKLKRARLEDPTFEKAFEVFTDDQVEARYLLTPDVMQRLVDLEQAFHGGKLRCSFRNEQLYLTLEGGDMFEPGSMKKPLDDPQRMRDLLTDFSALFTLIDDLGPRARSIRE